MSMKISENYPNYCLDKIQSEQGQAKGIENNVDNNIIQI